jgi:type VI secretion system protein ImpL
VVVPFMRNVAGSYPFVPQGHDLSLDDFNTFYKPNDGILWRFMRESLGQTVQLDGDHFAFEKKLGKDASSIYADSLLEFLQRSRDITTVFWPQGSPTPRVDMEVLIHPSPMVAQTTFTIGGKTIEYHNGPETWAAMSWPGENPAQGAGFVIRGANGMKEKAFQEGAWGLFRMFESGTITRSSNRVFTVAWQLQTHDVTLRVDFKPLRSESPFFGVPGRSEKPRLLQPLRDSNVNVPKQIVRSGQPCSF